MEATIKKKMKKIKKKIFETINYGLIGHFYKRTIKNNNYQSIIDCDNSFFAIIFVKIILPKVFLTKKIS